MVESAGVTLCDPLGCTAPRPPMLTSVALVVCQVKVVDPPGTIVLGSAEIEAVGAAGGGVLTGGAVGRCVEDGVPPQPTVNRDARSSRSKVQAKAFMATSNWGEERLNS